MNRGYARRDAGFVLVGVLIALALVAMAAVQTGQRLADKHQRDAEEELLQVGEQYRAAIESYWRNSPGTTRALPQRLEDLLLDPRFPQPRRHLRKLFVDPLAPERAWGLVRRGNALIGVYSQAPGEPFRQTGFSDSQLGFEGAKAYADWRFVIKLPTRSPVAAGTPPGPGSTTTKESS